MKRIAISAVVLLGCLIVAAVGLLIWFRVRSDRVDGLVTRCRADGLSYRQFVGNGGGYIAYNRPKLTTAAVDSSSLVGRTRSEVQNALGNPDYVVPRFEATHFGSCDWVYVAQGCKFAGIEFEGTDLFTVAFNDRGVVAVTERKQDTNPAYVKAACQKILDRQQATRLKPQQSLEK